MQFNINISQRGQVGAAEEALQVEGIVQIFLSCNNMIDSQQRNMTKHLMEENRLLFHLWQLAGPSSKSSNCSRWRWRRGTSTRGGEVGGQEGEVGGGGRGRGGGGRGSQNAKVAAFSLLPTTAFIKRWEVSVGQVFMKAQWPSLHHNNPCQMNVSETVKRNQCFFSL